MAHAACADGNTPAAHARGFTRSVRVCARCVCSLRGVLSPYRRVAVPHGRDRHETVVHRGAVVPVLDRTEDSRKEELQQQRDHQRAREVLQVVDRPMRRHLRHERCGRAVCARCGSSARCGRGAGAVRARCGRGAGA
eukprot:4680431-Prymnesium_polylepis.1